MLIIIMSYKSSVKFVKLFRHGKMESATEIEEVRSDQFVKMSKNSFL